MNKRTIMRHEAGEAILAEKMEALRQCFVGQGVEFINGGKSVGVRVPRAD